MLAFLKFTTPKEWLFAIALVLLGAYTLYIYRDGEKHIEAANAKVATAQIIHNEEVESRVKVALADALKQFQATPPPPPPAAQPNVVCYAPDSGKVPDRGLTVKGGDGAGGSVSFSTAKPDAGFDPAPAVSADGQRADAEIIRLHAKVTLLQRTVQAYQAAGLVLK